ncbi:MAG: EF-P 5-aminopentanol modification-associated protein YfmF [Eubacterium sp.]
MNYTVKEVADGVRLLSVKANHFKTNELSVSLALPLKKETASANAVMAGLLARRCAEFPTILQLNKKLASLYGATVAASVSKIGECQVLKLGMTVVDDRFSLDSQSISLEGIRLLCNMLFAPRLNSQGGFYEEDVEAEKRIIIEKIEAEENEKRTYVLRRAEELMFGGEPYAVNRYGTVDDVKALTCAEVFNAWQNALKTAQIIVACVGSADADNIEKLLKSSFDGIGRSYKPLDKAVFVPSCDRVKEHTERIDVKQGKLVLGFRVNLEPESELVPAMRTFCDVFGGGPYSKLFANVREKLSLCYYCSARYTMAKSYIMIQCGCNEENMDKAVSEILNQLEAIKNGDFDEELKSSKMAMSDLYNSVADMPETIENWFSSQIIYSRLLTPQQYADANNAVTKQQVQHCASLLSLDTVYKLTAEKEAE